MSEIKVDDNIYSNWRPATENWGSNSYFRRVVEDHYQDNWILIKKNGNIKCGSGFPWIKNFNKSFYTKQDIDNFLIKMANLQAFL